MARIYGRHFDREAQINRWLRRTTTGSVVGHTESASPVRLNGLARVTTTLSIGGVGGLRAGVSGSLRVAIFSTSGTWTKPPGALFVRMFAVGGGAGGRGGAATGSGVAATGGFGGSNGLVQFVDYLASDVAAGPLTVTVGTGGAGGAAATTNVNNAGGTGGVSSVTDGSDNYVRASGGASATSATGLFPTHDGGSISAGNVASGGGAGAAGWSPGVGSPQQGNTGIYAGNPGLGGSASTSGNGQTGGLGGLPGGGGGGGGAARTGNTSGAGGAGADGIVVIVTSV